MYFVFRALARKKCFLLALSQAKPEISPLGNGQPTMQPTRQDPRAHGQRAHGARRRVQARADARAEWRAGMAVVPPPPPRQAGRGREPPPPPPTAPSKARLAFWDVKTPKHTKTTTAKARLCSTSGTLHRAPVGQGPSGPDWLAIASWFWSGRALATGTAWAGLCLIHHHRGAQQAPRWAGFCLFEAKQNRQKRESRKKATVWSELPVWSGFFCFRRKID